MKTPDDIIFSEIESDSDGYESFYRYKEVVKAIRSAQIDAIDATVKACESNFVQSTRKLPLGEIADKLKKELE